MTCVICKHGETAPGNTTVFLQKRETTVVIKGVPADICDNCGEYYLSEEIAKKAHALVEAALAHGAEIEVLRFVAA